VTILLRLTRFASGSVDDLSLRGRIKPATDLAPRQIVVRVRRHDVLALVPGSNAMLRHQFAKPVLIHAHALREQLLPQARPAVFAFNLRVNRLDLCEQCIVAYPASGWPVLRSVLPALMISAGTDFQHLAYHRDWPVASIVRDELVLHINSFVKYAADSWWASKIQALGLPPGTRPIGLRTLPTINRHRVVD